MRPRLVPLPRCCPLSVPVSLSEERSFPRKPRTVSLLGPLITLSLGNSDFVPLPHPSADLAVTASIAAVGFLRAAPSLGLFYFIWSLLVCCFQQGFLGLYGVNIAPVSKIGQQPRGCKEWIELKPWTLTHLCWFTAEMKCCSHGAELLKLCLIQKEEQKLFMSFLCVYIKLSSYL